jgi:glycosyltransferase involved in cell wall biosynthesis
MLADCDVCIAHNVAGLHKNLPLTAALHQFAQEYSLRLIHWYHDLAWTNPQYQSELHEGSPWDLLRKGWSKAQIVTISADRRSDLAHLLQVSPDDIQVIPGGIDPPRFLRLTPRVARLHERLRWFEADALLLYPTRLTRRKNVELALDILAALREQTGRDVRLLVTGPPGPHNPANARYLAALNEQRQRLHLDKSAHLLYSAGDEPAVALMLDDDDIASLYALSDALLFTSVQEGFGIPILEAGLSGLPIFCSDLRVLREIAGEDATYFNSASEPPNDIAQRLWSAMVSSPRYRLRTRVRQQYSWDTIIRRHLIPLIEGQA